MATATSISPETTTFEVKQSAFLEELVRQIRAQDSYGFYQNWADELILKPYVVSKSKKKEISVDGDVDPATKGRILCFYRAIAAQVEVRTGLLSQVVIDLSHEGFGWSLVFSGRLLLLAKTLRDAQRFGFDSLEKLALEGEKLIQSGVEMANRFPEVGRL